eukprot:3240667-Karenia_brevis.AAC.1
MKFGSIVHISAIKLGDTLIHDSALGATVLAEHWGPVFCKTAICKDAADSIFRETAPACKWEWGRARPMSIDAFERVVDSTWFDTQPGRDGIPYS